MTTDEVASTIKRMFEKQSELAELNKQRQVEEKALVIEYKVDECNKKRNDLVAKYGALSQQLSADIQALQASLGAK